MDSPRDVARLPSDLTAEAAALLDALPSSRDCTRLTDSKLLVVVGLLLGLSVATPGVCAFGSLLDALGDHALSSGRRSKMSRRHAELNLRFRVVLGDAGFQSVLEPFGLALRDG